MSDKKSPEGQVETAPAEVENLLTYADLLQIEWILDDKIEEWKWRGAQTEPLAGNGHETLNRVREMIRRDEANDRKGGQS